MRNVFYLFLFPFFIWGQTSIAIFTGHVEGVGPWDPRNISSGITGSEEAVIYLSKELALLGFRVTVFGDPPLDSPYSSIESNPRYVSRQEPILEKFDIGISWRMPHLGKILHSFARRVYLWPHDICNVLLTQEQIDAFDGVLWLSNWQRDQWCSVNPPFSRFKEIYGNGIDPDTFEEIQPRKNPYSCIYASSYDRGLEVLLDIWPAVKKRFPLATLDIYYGWKVWATHYPQEVARLKAKLVSLRFLGVKEHGTVGHSELNQAMNLASFWTYPCTLAVETFCITALRAQYAGAIPVILEEGAMKETVQGGFRCLQREEYLGLLCSALEQAEQISEEERKKQRDFILRKYTWAEIASQWKHSFDAEMGL